jgi:hypothetical protein
LPGSQALIWKRTPNRHASVQPKRDKRSFPDHVPMKAWPH